MEITLCIVAVIRNEKGEMLMVRRADNGLWAFPSGRVEPGESISETVVRECREELSIEVQPEYLIGVYSDPGKNIHFSHGKTRHYVILSFQCSWISGEIRLQEEEVTDYRFVSADEIPDETLHGTPDRLADAAAFAGTAFIR